LPYTMRMPRSRDDLLVELADQCELLSNACAAFDNGSVVEFKNIAARLRLLLHDTRVSHSLLGQLGVKDRLVYTNDAMRFHPPGLNGQSQTNMGHCLTVHSAHGLIYEARVGLINIGRTDCLDFDSWWNETLMEGAQGYKLTRKLAVLGAANKDGGAHVDPHDLGTEYEQLSRREQWFRVLLGPPDFVQGSPVPATLRGIAYEVLTTIENNTDLIV
jgi:hypothetical protein